MDELEQSLRKNLEIPDDAASVVIFSQSSHMDWDWLDIFPRLCNDPKSPYIINGENGQVPAFDILADAVTLMLANQALKPPYFYSVAEVAFLQAYVEQNPDQLAKLRQCGPSLHLCGGGMTSPDNLLPHGETFIRNFLVAATWNAANLGLPVQNVWIPDDFGHDSQLPVAVAAMGLVGAGFSRVPGSTWGGNLAGEPPLGQDSIFTQLKDKGADFLWEAGDGSTIFGHCMLYGYQQGDAVGVDPGTNILTYYTCNGGSPTVPYVFVPVGSDFQPPVGVPSRKFSGTTNLWKLMYDWNHGTGPNSYDGGKGPYAVAATFDHYVQLVWSRAAPPRRRFDGVPYWLGCYASRPDNKIVHYSASRTLVAAEVLGLVADAAGFAGRPPAYPSPNPARLAGQQAAWAALVPSTHHDYITGTSGTAYVDVNAVEQLPLLRQAEAQARHLLDQAVGQIAGGIVLDPDTLDPAVMPVVVCNPLGFEREGIVSLPGGAALGARAVRAGPGAPGPVQAADDGSLLFLAPASAPVPSLGYTTFELLKTPVQTAGPALSFDIAPSGACVMANEFLSVSIDRESGGIVSFVDVPSGNPSSLLAGIGNDLAFYDDTGNIYRYGNEAAPDWAPARPAMTPMQPRPPMSHTIDFIERGPVRVTVRVLTRVQFSTGEQTFTRTYSLVAGEPLLRMSLYGSLPELTSLFCSFSFAAGKVDSLTHGTPYHWSDMRMVPYWPLPLFYATHDFLLPIANNHVAAAIYHEGAPAWGYDEAGTLLGTMLRNTNGPVQPQGAGAADPAPHLQKYALRAPRGFLRSRAPLTGGNVAATGQPLREALQFNTPMAAWQVAPPLTSTYRLPRTYSLASVTSPETILTAAKAADDNQEVILRLYDPSGGSSGVAVSTAVDASGALINTALEGPFPYPRQQPPNATMRQRGTTGFQVDMDRALATVRLVRPAP